MAVDLTEIWGKNPFVRAKGGPQPLHEVKIVKATTSFVYVYKQTADKIAVVKLKHGSVKNHAKDLVDPPPGEYEPWGEIDPKTYKGPSDIMPLPGVPLPPISRDPGAGGGKGLETAKWAGKKSQKGQQTKVPDIKKMVPVFKWTKTAIWMFVDNPQGLPILTKMGHKAVKKYKDKLTAPEGAFEYVGKLDPTMYTGPEEIYPLDWTVAQGVHGVESPNTPTKAVFKKGQSPEIPPSETASVGKVIQPPPGWDVSIDPDPNGLPEIGHPKTGAEASLLPDGSIASWDYSSSTYTPLKLTADGKAVVVAPNAKDLTLDDIEKMKDAAQPAGSGRAGKPTLWLASTFQKVNGFLPTHGWPQGVYFPMEGKLSGAITVFNGYWIYNNAKLPVKLRVSPSKKYFALSIAPDGALLFDSDGPVPGMLGDLKTAAASAPTVAAPPPEQPKPPTPVPPPDAAQKFPEDNALLPAGCKMTAMSPKWKAETWLGDSITYDANIGKWTFDASGIYQMLMNGCLAPISFNSTGSSDPLFTDSVIGTFNGKPGFVAIATHQVIIDGTSFAVQWSPSMVGTSFLTKYATGVPAFVPPSVGGKKSGPVYAGAALPPSITLGNPLPDATSFQGTWKTGGKIFNVHILPSGAVWGELQPGKDVEPIWHPTDGWSPAALALSGAKPALNAKTIVAGSKQWAQLGLPHDVKIVGEKGEKVGPTAWPADWTPASIGVPRVAFVRAPSESTREVWDIETGKLIWDSEGGYSDWALTFETGTAPAAPKVAKSSLKPPTVPTPSLATGVPKLSSLTLVGSGAGLGGAGKKDIYKNAAGKQFLWKPSISKNGSTEEPFRAYTQQAFAQIARMVNPAHIPISVDRDASGKLGSLQGMIDLADPPTLATIPPAKLTDQEKADVAGEHLLDWLMSQHDSHKNNLVRTKDGHVLSVDKEQGFKYAKDDKLSIDYHPNSAYGESEPYYNTFWRDWKDGKFDFDPKTLATTLEKIDNITPDAFLAALHPYADASIADPVARENFIERMVLRKLNMRREFEDFFSDLYAKKTGEKGEFTFDDGWVTEADKSKIKYKIIDQTAQTVASEQGIKVKEYAPTEGTPNLVPDRAPSSMYALTFSKETSKSKAEEMLKELGMDVLAYTTGKVNHVFIVDKHAFDAGKVKKKVPISDTFDYGGGEKPKYWPRAMEPKLATKNADDLAKIASIPIPAKSGYQITSDGTAIEGQSLKAKKIVALGGGERVRLMFKLRKEQWEKLQGAAGGATGVPYSFREMEQDKKTGAYHEKAATIDSTTGVKWDVDGVELFLATDSHKYAYMGSIYASMSAEGNVQQRVRAALNKLIAGFGDELFRNPTDEEQTVMKMRRLLWAFAPQTNDKTSVNTAAALQKVLVAAGIDPSLVDQVRSEEVVPGYATMVLPGRWKKILPGKKWFPWQGIGSTEAAVSIMQSGLLGIHERNLAGIARAGASYSSDVESGSGDNTLLRITPENGFSGGFGGTGYGGYAAIVHPKVLDRLDSVQYNSDSFGWMKMTKNAHSYGYTYKDRDPIEKRIGELASSYSSTNELLMRKGVDRKYILRIVTPSESNRKTLIKEAIEAGVEDVNGVPLSDFVGVCKSIGDGYERYVRPLLVK